MEKVEVMMVVKLRDKRELDAILRKMRVTGLREGANEIALAWSENHQGPPLFEALAREIGS